MDGATEARFSLVAGGPLHAVLGRLGLLGPDGLPRGAAAAALAALAWGAPLAAETLQAVVQGRAPDLGYLADPTAPARYLVAVAVMILAERPADLRIGRIVDSLRRSGLLAGEARRLFEAWLARADRWSASAAVELLLLGTAFAWAAFIAEHNIAVGGPGWDGHGAPGAVVLSAAGTAACLASTPLFAFLVLRWGWRFLVWSALLLQVSRLPLQLVPLHPDRCGGLGFLSLYPGVFRGLVFALGCVVAALLVAEAAVMTDGAGSWQAVAFAWICLVCVLFVAPLLFFTAALYEMRERELLRYSQAAAIEARRLHDVLSAWPEGEGPVPRASSAGAAPGELAAGATNPGAALGELALALETLRQTRTLPIDRTAVMHLLTAAAAPMVAVGASRMSLPDLLARVLGLVL